MQKEKINKNTNIGKLILEHPETIEVFLKYQLQCACCPASAIDTIEEGARLHGFTEEKINELVNEIRELVQQKTQV